MGKLRPWQKVSKRQSMDSSEIWPCCSAHRIAFLGANENGRVENCAAEHQIMLPDKGNAITLPNFGARAFLPNEEA